MEMRAAANKQTQPQSPQKKISATSSAQRKGVAPLDLSKFHGVAALGLNRDPASTLGSAAAALDSFAGSTFNNSGPSSHKRY